MALMYSVTASVGQIHERHRRHRVLMDAVDRIILHDRAGTRVVMPRPLSSLPLRRTDRGRYLGSDRQRLRIVRAGVQAGQRLQRVHLVSERTHVRAVPGAVMAGYMRVQNRSARPNKELTGAAQALLDIDKGTGSY